MIEEMNIRVDESAVHPRRNSIDKSESIVFDEPKEIILSVLGEGEEIKSTEPDNHKLNPDPFLIAGTKVLSGQGTALVCAVGPNTYLNRTTKTGTINESEILISEKTFLEDKLKKIERRMLVIGFFVILISIISQIAFLFFYGVVGPDGLFSNESLMKLAKAGIIALVLFIVIIPEGLGVAIQIALSMSVSRLKDDANILVKNHTALQNCGTVNEICISKTGMLTSGNPDVQSMHRDGDW
jgi:magnesium-transporting ATPase (P-type)